MMNNTIEGKTSFADWTRFTDDSEVWVFQSNKDLEENTVSSVEKLAKSFCETWQTHGVQLEADAKVVYNRFVVFIVQGGNGPSGCSKDKLTHFMQGLGKEFQTDFFNRLMVLYRSDNGDIHEVGLHDMETLVVKGSMNKDTLVFNNLVSSKKELLTNWELPLKNSWHDNFAF